jgi:hypothetical protein
MKKIYQIRKGDDGKWYPREMTGACKWWQVGFDTQQAAEAFILSPENGRGEEEIEFEK